MRISIFVLLSICAMIAEAQSPLYFPLEVKEAVKNGTRTLTGEPGEKYWVNTANYDIDVALDPASNQVEGEETIEYINNSPDTLNELVIANYMDVYKKGNKRDFAYDINYLNEGVEIIKLAVDGQVYAVDGDKVKRVGTNMIIKLDSPILPKKSAEIEVAWSFTIVDKYPGRTGHYKDSTFFVGYFYPKVAVYDDIDGWDKHNFQILAEFYSDQNNYNVNIRAPRNFVVYATGELKNAEAVLLPKYFYRWSRAHSSTEVVNIVKEDEIHQDKTVAQDWVVWRYEARNCPDFAFATSDKFMWDGRMVEVEEGRNVFVDAAYAKKSADYREVADIAAQSLVDYSTKIPGIPYPFPCMTIFNGNSGMEFPMMCNDASASAKEGTVGLTYHEVAHTYMPFFMGTNERKYAWMDEGWASLFPQFYINDFVPEYDYIGARAGRYYHIAGKEVEVPIVTLTEHTTGNYDTYRQATYYKPHFAYFYLYELLGEETFKKALKGYMNTWAGKHPIPSDFFYGFSKHAGVDLDWYWKNWFYENNYIDLAVEKQNNGVNIINKGGAFAPIRLVVTYTDGSTHKINKQADVWKENALSCFISIKNMAKVKKVELDTSIVIDVDKSDNTWVK